MRSFTVWLAACLFFPPFEVLAAAPTTNLHELKWLALFGKQE